MSEFSENKNENFVQYEDEYNKNANPGDPVLYPLTFKVKDVCKMAKSMRFVAIVSIVFGALSCFSYAGIISGILTIIAGVKLKTAAETFDTVGLGLNSYREELLGEDLLGFFKYNGIVWILSIVSTVFSVINIVSMFGNMLV